VAKDHSMDGSASHGLSRTDELLRTACGILFYLMAMGVTLGLAMQAVREHFQLRPAPMKLYLLDGTLGLSLAFVATRLVYHIRLLLRLLRQGRADRQAMASGAMPANRVKIAEVEKNH